jgi:hypothetical protein
MREHEIPGPSHASHREKIMTEVDNHLKNWFDQIDDLTASLDKDCQKKTKLSAKKEILDKNLKEVTARIHENEKKLETAKKRVTTLEASYKEEAEGKVTLVGEYECPICKEICGNEQKHMVCITTCGHRFCKECVDRILPGKESSFWTVRNDNNSYYSTITIN